MQINVIFNVTNRTKKENSHTCFLFFALLFDQNYCVICVKLSIRLNFPCQNEKKKKLFLLHIKIDLFGQNMRNFYDKRV